MASPPYRSPAASPPHPSSTSIPISKKRSALVPNAYQLQNPKRRKQSSFSTSTTSTHPLRQTSFPPEESGDALNVRSPSVESDFTGFTGGQSVAASTIGPRKGKGGRKKGVDGSVRSGTAKATADGKSGTGQAGEEIAEEEEEEEDDGMVDAGGKVDRAAEKKKLAVLIDAFNNDQADRYDMYRRVKLKKETVRRITNQTLSQSVPPSVITTINGFTKVFIGTLIERAREVQQQYSDAERSLPSPRSPSGRQDTIESKHVGTLNGLNGAFDSENNFDVSVQIPKRSTFVGPLLPDHLREALRRYKRDGEGGGSGQAGTSLGLGLSGTKATRIQGKRLFR